jgi:signal transduction histidine kinase
LALAVFVGGGVVVLWGGASTEALRAPSWLLVAVLQCGGIVFRRSVPVVSFGVVWAGAIVQLVLVQEVGPQNVAVLVMLYSVAAYGSRVLQTAGLASTLVGGVLAGWFLATVLPAVRGTSAGSALFLTVLCVLILFVAWVLGIVRVLVVRATRERIAGRVEVERARHAIAVEEERARIARDVHDVVAHSLTVMIAQAEGARLVADTRGTMEEAGTAALVTIADTGRSALAEVRGVLSELRTGERDSAQPSLARLPVLVDQFQRAGVAIAITSAGTERPLPPRVDMAAFRILQEALTNAVRHGAAAHPPTLDMTWGDEDLRMTVRNECSGDLPVSGGHGVIGMRERAHYAGGTLEILQQQHTFTVTAVLPVERPVSA